MDDYKASLSLFPFLNIQFDETDLDEKDLNSNRLFIIVLKFLIFTDEQEMFSLEYLHYEQLQKMFSEKEHFPSVFATTTGIFDIIFRYLQNIEITNYVRISLSVADSIIRQSEELLEIFIKSQLFQFLLSIFPSNFELFPEIISIFAYSVDSNSETKYKITENDESSSIYGFLEEIMNKNVEKTLDSKTKSNIIIFMTKTINLFMKNNDNKEPQSILYSFLNYLMTFFNEQTLNETEFFSILCNGISSMIEIFPQTISVLCEEHSLISIIFDLLKKTQSNETKESAESLSMLLRKICEVSNVIEQNYLYEIKNITNNLDILFSFSLFQQLPTVISNITNILCFLCSSSIFSFNDLIQNSYFYDFIEQIRLLFIESNLSAKKEIISFLLLLSVHIDSSQVSDFISDDVLSVMSDFSSFSYEEQNKILPLLLDLFRKQCINLQYFQNDDFSESLHELFDESENENQQQVITEILSILGFEN